MFKVSRGLSPDIVNELFQFRKQNTLRINTKVSVSNPLGPFSFSATESLKFFGSKVWALVPHEVKQLETLGKFRNVIKQRKPISCPCILCKRYIHRIGFL